MLKIILKTFILLIIIFGIFSCNKKKQLIIIENNNLKNFQEYIKVLIEKTMKEKKITGLAISLIDDQNIIMQEGFGYSDKANNIKVTIDTSFLTASVTKVFTAMAVMQLSEKGKIDLNKPINTYLSEFKIKSHIKKSLPITVHSLLTMHSGLPSDYLKGILLDNNPNKDLMNSFMKLPVILQNVYSISQPDQYYCYSNINYSLLGIIISKVSSQSYFEYIQNNIFKKLNMKNSLFFPEKNSKFFISKGYIKGKEVPSIIMSGIPEGGIYSSISDLTNVMKMIFANGKYNDEQIITEQFLSSMMTKQNINISMDFDFQIGFGFNIGYLPGNDSIKLVYKDGGTNPFSSIIAFLPEHKLGVCLLINSNEQDPNKIAFELLRITLELKTGIKQNKKIKDPMIKLSADQIKNITGLYSSELGPIEITNNKNNLKIKLMGNSFFLIPIKPDYFRLEFRLFDLIPINPGDLDSIRLSYKKINNEEVLAYYDSGFFKGLGTKININKNEKIPKLWMEKIGIYEIINQDINPFVEKFKIYYDIKYNLLFIEIKIINNTRSLIFPIRVISNNQAIIIGNGRHLGETIQIINNKNEKVLYYSGLIFKIIK